MPDEIRSSQEIAQGLGAFLATQRGDRPQEREPSEHVDEDEEQDSVEALGDHAEEVEAEDDESSEDDEDESATDEPEFTLEYKYKGQDYRITDRAEAAKYVQLGKHLSERQEEVIDRERKVEQGWGEVDQHRQRYTNLLSELEGYLQTPLGDPPNEKDYPDRATYLEADKAFSEARAALDAVRAERQRETQALQQRQQEQLRRWVEEQDQLILAEVPEWNDPAVRQSEAREMEEYARSVGVSPQALQNPWLVRDKAFVLVLRDAMRYRRATEQGSAAVKRNKTKDAAPGSGKEVRQPSKSKRLREHKQRIRKSGGREEAIAPVMGDAMRRLRQLQPK